MEGPVDRCPYARPFADDFDSCPAYQPVRYVPLDLTHAPLRAVWTCGHLETSREGGGFYGSCRLGDAAAREAWVRRIAGDRLARWQQTAREFGIALAEPLAAMFAAKARQLELAGTPGAEQDSATAALRDAADRFLACNFELMDARIAELEGIGFPVEPLRAVTTMAMADMITRKSATPGFTPPAEVMSAFPADTRDFLFGLFRGATLGEDGDEA